MFSPVIEFRAALVSRFSLGDFLVTSLPVCDGGILEFLLVFLGNYSGTLTRTKWNRFYNLINNLPIYKSFQKQVLILLSHDTINIPVRSLNLVNTFNALLLRYKII